MIPFKQFGDIALNLTTRGFLDPSEGRMGVVSGLHQKIHEHPPKV